MSHRRCCCNQTGACCRADFGCVNGLTAEECAGSPHFGVFQGPGATCTPTTCRPANAACCGSSSCGGVFGSTCVFFQTTGGCTITITGSGEFRQKIPACPSEVSQPLSASGSVVTTSGGCACVGSHAFPTPVSATFHRVHPDTCVPTPGPNSQAVHFSGCIPAHGFPYSNLASTFTHFAGNLISTSFFNAGHVDTSLGITANSYTTRSVWTRSANGGTDTATLDTTQTLTVSCNFDCDFARPAGGSPGAKRNAAAEAELIDALTKPKRCANCGGWKDPPSLVGGDIFALDRWRRHGAGHRSRTIIAPKRDLWVPPSARGRVMGSGCGGGCGGQLVGGGVIA